MIALNNQSLIDLAIQTAGSAAAAYNIAAANGLSVTDDLAAGVELAGVDVVNKAVADYFKNRGLKPATKTETSDTTDRIFFEEMPLEFF